MDLLKGFQKELAHRQAESDFSAKKYSSALKRYLHLLESSLKEDDKFDSAYYNNRLGDCYEKLEHQKHEDRLRDHEKAGEHYLKAAELYYKLGDHKKAGEIYEKGAKAFEELSKYSRAAEFFVKSAIMFTDVKDYFSASFAYHAAAEYYDKDGGNENAAKAYLEASTLDMKVEDMSSASIGFKKAAKCYEKLKNWGKAVDCYAGSVEVDSLLRRYLDVADSYEHMAHCYYETGDFKNSLYYHKRAAEVRLDNKDEANAAYSYREAGHVQYLVKNFKDSILLFLKSAKLYSGLKNNGQVAFSYSKIAECYVALNDFENAADFYLEAGKAGMGDDITGEAADAFNSAAEYYIKAGDEKLDGKDYAQAANLYWSAGECYDSLRRFDLAAGQFIAYAEIFKQLGDAAKTKKGFTKASEEYAKGGDIWGSAESFVNIEDYKNASELYLNFASQKLSEKSQYCAAVGFMEAGNCYRRLHEDTLMKNYYGKAVLSFTKEADALRVRGNLAEKDFLMLGDIYRKLGECHQNIFEIDNAVRQFTKAVEEYGKTGDELKKNLARAFLQKVEALKAIDHGYYPKATELLNDSKAIFEKIIPAESWTREYRKYLADNLGETRDLLNRIELKPEVALDLDKRSFTFTNHMVLFNVVLRNEGKYSLKEVSFLAHMPEEIIVDELPKDVSEIRSGEQVKAYFEVTPKKSGEFRIRPLEIFYQDKDGNKYVKASNEILLEVAERPQTDFKNYRLAIEIFLKYARVHEGNGSYFYAGDGFREAAFVYGKFNTDATLVKYYDEAIRCYLKYCGEEEEKNLEDLVRIKRLADSYWHAAECYQEKGDLSNTLKSYESARSHYEMARAENNVRLADAFIGNVEGRMAVEHGEYQKASGLLSGSLSMLDEVIKSGRTTSEHMKLLEKTESETRLLLQTLKAKPDVSVVVERLPKAVEGKVLELSAIIYNPGENAIRDVTVSLQVPAQFKVNRSPETVKEIGPKKSQRITLELIPTAIGDFTFKPLDISYLDLKNKSYSKGTSEITVNVSPQAAAPPGEEKSKEAESKIHVSVNLEDPKPTLLGDTLDVDGTLINEGDEPAYGIRFMGNASAAFEMLETPEEVKELQPSESRNISLKMKTLSAGEFNLKPLEIYYKNKQGKGFFTSSNQIKIQVDSAKQRTQARGAQLEAGSTYFVLEDKPEKALQIFIDYLSNQKLPAIYFTRTNPEKLSQKRELEKAEILWVTDAVTGKENIISSNLQDISFAITEFTGKNPGSVVLLDIIEYLIENNDFQMVLHFIQNMRDKISMTDSRMIITLNDKILNAQDLNSIKKETKQLT